MTQLTTDKVARKAIPMFRGVLQYFPDAICEIARVSQIGNDQHNPGEPLHWAKDKSRDEADCILRHLLQADQLDVDGVLHAAKVAWRALALLQRIIDCQKDPVNGIPALGFEPNLSSGMHGPGPCPIGEKGEPGVPGVLG